MVNNETGFRAFCEKDKVKLRIILLATPREAPSDSAAAHMGAPRRTDRRPGQPRPPPTEAKKAVSFF